jgi:hypothetical protein
MERTDLYTRRLRAHVPVVPEPEVLTDRILAAIGPGQATSARPTTVSDILRGILMKPSVRYAYAAAVSLAVGLFLYQQVSLVISLQTLEHRMEGRERPRPRAAVTYTVNSESLRGTGALGLLEPLVDPREYRLRNGDLSVKKASLEAYATGTNLRTFRRLASALGLDLPEARMESLFDELKRSAVVQLRLDAEGG